jgi:hypothetical protein
MTFAKAGSLQSALNGKSQIQQALLKKLFKLFSVSKNLFPSLIFFSLF